MLPIFHSYTPERKTKYEKENIVDTYAEGVRGSTRITIEKDLIIPLNVNSSNEGYCKVVQISYEVIVEAITPALLGNVVIIIPITIGAVPFRNHQVNNSAISLPNDSKAATSEVPFSAPNEISKIPVSVPLSELRKFVNVSPLFRTSLYKYFSTTAV